MQAIDPHEQFTRLLIEHEPELLRFILVTVPNLADARDILQECSVALWRRFSDYDSERPFVAWAYGFARMEVRRFLRKSQQRAQLTKRAMELLIQDQHQYQHDSNDRDQHLEHCLTTLPAHQRKLLTGYYHEGHSVNELSEQNGPTIEDDRVRYPLNILGLSDAAWTAIGTRDSTAGSHGRAFRK